MTKTQLSVLTRVVKPVFYDAEDYIVHAGDDVEAMHVLASGHANVLDTNNKVQETLRLGASFGEEILAIRVLPKHQTYACAILTQAVCEVMVIPAEDLKAAFKEMGRPGRIAIEVCLHATALDWDFLGMNFSYRLFFTATPTTLHISENSK